MQPWFWAVTYNLLYQENNIWNLSQMLVVSQGIVVAQTADERNRIGSFFYLEQPSLLLVGLVVNISCSGCKL